MYVCYWLSTTSLASWPQLSELFIQAKMTTNLTGHGNQMVSEHTKVVSLDQITNIRHADEVLACLYDCL